MLLNDYFYSREIFRTPFRKKTENTLIIVFVSSASLDFLFRAGKERREGKKIDHHYNVLPPQYGGIREKTLLGSFFLFQFAQAYSASRFRFVLSRVSFTIEQSTGALAISTWKEVERFRWLCNNMDHSVFDNRSVSMSSRREREKS